MAAIKFALIQSGHCVFGTGHTYRGALLDAGNWLEHDEHGRYTPQRIENELIKPRGQRVDGDFYVIENDEEEFNSYMKNQGGFIKRGENWYSK